ncbi:c-type cytochrome [Methyloligella sp. 2.7D]|uniref:c-type cytochrome n=1 Tax=unclassified Methyloligella TaxID=2625955 RepID=UPI00157BE19D|nr:c-type cytochrome [Methyloligella sp. GL2]QKP77341.1 cytochrome c [Methyloligella sp. GL2]
MTFRTIPPILGLLLSFAAVLLVPAASALAADSIKAKQGKEIAERWCSSCHLVSTDQKQAGAVGTPSFMAIAAKYDGAVDVLQGFLIEPHPPMPDMALTRREIQDLIAYIASLKPASETPAE